MKLKIYFKKNYTLILHHVISFDYIGTKGLLFYRYVDADEDGIIPGVKKIESYEEDYDYEEDFHM